MVNNKVALITGASRGIGKAIAKKFSENDIDVIINYKINEEAAKKTFAEINNNGMIIKADITSEDEVKEMISKIREKYDKIDILINNANPPIPDKKFTDLSWDEFNTQLETNIKGSFNCIKHTIDLMKEGSSIINILTTYIIGNPPKNLSHYITAKQGMWGLTKSLAIELADKKIRVNAISPEMTNTDLTSNVPDIFKKMLTSKIPLKRLCTVEDISNVVLFLSSKNAEFITGVNLPINGGSCIN